MFNQNYFVYITTNSTRSTLYIGVTVDLPRRVSEHFENSGDEKTFAGKYYCYRLLYYECFSDSAQAIAREKQRKGWSRSKKEALIRKQNPFMKFLNEEVQNFSK